MISPKECRSERIRLGLTQQKLADEAHVSRSTVRNYELGRSTPSDSMILAMANILALAGSKKDWRNNSRSE